MKIPEPIEKYINENALEFSNPAYINTDPDGKILDAGGELEHYSLEQIKNLNNIAKAHEVFEGYLPFTEDIGAIPLVKITNDIYADIYIFEKAGSYWILLLDSSELRKALKNYFQDRNEEKLFLDKYFNFGEDHSFFDIVRFLDITVIELIAENKYKALGKAPKWADFLIPGSKGIISREALTERYPFMETFIDLAVTFWESNNKGLLKSEIWTETDEHDNEYFMEAEAINLMNRKFLLIQQSPCAADEKHFLIQKGRELSLEHELRIKAEKALNRKNRELKELNATKDKFFSIIAHDLRNPIGAFRSVAELFSNHYTKMSPKEIREIIRMIDDQSNQLFRLLENLLQWSRSQMGLIEYKADYYDLKDLTDMVVTVFRHYAEEKSIILYNGVQRGTIIKCDNDLIRIVLRNLLSNAIKYSNEGGRVEIKTARVGGDTVVKVSDNGVGMPAEDVYRLFRIDENMSKPGTAKEKGTGLGLILCKDFVELHGGRLWVESVPGEGSVFSFSLPK